MCPFESSIFLFEMHGLFILAKWYVQLPRYKDRNAEGKYLRQREGENLDFSTESWEFQSSRIPTEILGTPRNPKLRFYNPKIS